MSNGDEYMYPQSCVMGSAGEYHTEQLGGLTKREYFAAMAMQGLLASCADKVHSPFSLAPDAVDCADALLARLEEDRT